MQDLQLEKLNQLANNLIDRRFDFGKAKAEFESFYDELSLEVQEKFEEQINNEAFERNIRACAIIFVMESIDAIRK